VEYAYGNWNYFALNEDDLCTGTFALCCPSQGTLGRRTFDVAADRISMKTRIWCEELFELKVARADAEALRLKLEKRYDLHRETKVDNALNGLAFVKDDEDYLCWNNCNHVVAAWLEELGCEVSGCGCFADFRIESAER
jgi:hypothetical protein